MPTSVRARLGGTGAAIVLSLGIAAAPAAAQPQQGLINVDVSHNVVQVPVAVAANLCNVQVGVLASGLAQGPVTCTADAVATSVSRGTGGSGGGPQTGLVNVAITDNTIQVPVGIAANICDVQAGVLAAGLLQGPATCTATGNGSADSGGA
jgi:hypothetical protein